MNDFENMSLYTESRLEDIQNQAENLQLLRHTRQSLTRWVAFSIVVILGVLAWWVA